MAEVDELSDDTLEAFVKENDVCLIDFWAPWCGPCMMLAPTIKQLAQAYEGKVGFGKINIDENKVFAGKYNVMSIPTLVLFRGGEAVDRIVGAVPADRIKSVLDGLL